MRTVLAVLFAAPALALAQATLAQVQYEGADREKVLAAGAKQEGEVMLYTSLVPEDLTALAAAFDVGALATFLVLGRVRRRLGLPRAGMLGLLLLAASMLLQLTGYLPFLSVLWSQRPTAWWLPFAVAVSVGVVNWRRLLLVSIPTFLRGLSGRFEHR